jgi:hypothetical protein
MIRYVVQARRVSYPAPIHKLPPAWIDKNMVNRASRFWMCWQFDLWHEPYKPGFLLKDVSQTWFARNCIKVTHQDCKMILIQDMLANQIKNRSGLTRAYDLCFFRLAANCWRSPTPLANQRGKVGSQNKWLYRTSIYSR